MIVLYALRTYATRKHVSLVFVRIFQLCVMNTNVAWDLLRHTDTACSRNYIIPVQDKRGSIISTASAIASRLPSVALLVSVRSYARKIRTRHTNHTRLCMR